MYIPATLRQVVQEISTDMKQAQNSTASTAQYFLTQIAGSPFACTVTFHRPGVQEEPLYTERHSHSFYELLHIVEGSGSILTDEQTIGYQRGFTCLVAPNVYHTRHTEKRGAFFSVKFVPDKRQERTPDLPKELAAALDSLNAMNVFLMAENGHLDVIFGVLSSAMQSSAAASPLVGGGLVSAILSIVLDCVSSSTEKTSKRVKSMSEASSLIHRAAVIDSFFDQVENANTTMDELCSLVHVSRGQLNRIIKAQYGVTFKQKMIDIRIAYIKHLLASTEHSIPAITSLANFSSEGNLSQFFKKYCGLSPTAYRRQMREKAGG